MSYRPIADTWILARSKTKYYGAYPAGFLSRARNLLGVSNLDSVLHVCGGMVRKYPFKGFGINDKTLDLDPACEPDFLQDARDPLPSRILLCSDKNCCEGEHYHKDCVVPWDAVLIDRPYSEADAEHYVPGADKLPNLNDLLQRSLQVVPVGGKVGTLDYLWPHPGKSGREVAVVGVGTGRNARARWFCVFERLE